MVTYGAALAEARSALAKAGVESAALDARLLLANASGLDAAALISRSGDALPPLVHEAFSNHLKRRENGEPVARIVGTAEFWGLSLAVNSYTLIPRPETETLVETVLAEARRNYPPTSRICDLGTGSGAIVIALLSELHQAFAVATDSSEGALRVAERNAERHGVRPRIKFELADFAGGPDGPFDIVVSNPPYIRSEELGELQREVRSFDPRLALDGGPDGLDAYRAILRRADELLAKDGLLALEIGYDQGQQVTGLCREAGFADVRIGRDLAGLDRVVLARARI